MANPETPPSPPVHGGLVKRSVTIQGHRTSLSLELAFWDELKRIARERGQSIGQLVAAIDESRTGNLSSAIRLFILDQLRGPRPSHPE